MPIIIEPAGGAVLWKYKNRGKKEPRDEKEERKRHISDRGIKIHLQLLAANGSNSTHLRPPPFALRQLPLPRSLQLR